MIGFLLVAAAIVWMVVQFPFWSVVIVVALGVILLVLGLIFWDKVPTPRRSFPTGYFDVEVVGESHYLRTLQRLMKAQDGPTVTLFLEPEPDNEYDKNAVRVLTEAGETVGYLPRETAREYQRPLEMLKERGSSLACDAILKGGTPTKPNIGVWLSLQSPDEIVDTLIEEE